MSSVRRSLAMGVAPKSLFNFRNERQMLQLLTSPLRLDPEMDDEEESKDGDTDQDWGQVI